MSKARQSWKLCGPEAPRRIQADGSYYTRTRWRMSAWWWTDGLEAISRVTTVARLHKPSQCIRGEFVKDRINILVFKNRILRPPNLKMLMEKLRHNFAIIDFDLQG